MQHQQRPPSKAASAQLLPSSVLYRSPDSATVILDIPRSLEESQVLPGEEHSAQCRIYSSVAPTAPFELPEPAHGLEPDATASPASQIATLMTAESLRSVLEVLSQDYTGAYCLPRQIAPESSPSSSPSLQTEEDSEPCNPPDANHLHGSIYNTAQAFLQRAPKFNLIVLDPPWPNRSARRKTTAAAGYKTASSLSSIRALLCAIPVRAHLHDDGLVAVWITNKPRIVYLLTAPGGVFEEWGLEFVAEWTWLKVTANGRPLFPLAAAWRRPWEKLLVAKRKGQAAPRRLAPKTIVAVPDLHSRKPNLRGLFGDILGPGYSGLEVFARGLTAGWWSWGDEVLKFQQPQHWHTKQSP
ncbi:MT-A70 family [Akanthomyces lecanii RCEF 1005]|uniref:MT-A70 family n=1 Tax=Akanthomyces lecanii RCEF 1005 TaxID=1081108 RepID=A0A162ITI6_CORDF|nr:MT-A70 family [Akanthomyces lecanii RCEF 1005]